MTYFAPLRYLLREKPAGFVTAFLGTAGVTMIYGYDFFLGVGALALAAVWGILAWSLSDVLRRKKPTPPKKQKPKPSVVEKYERDCRNYRAWQCGVPFLIILALAAFGWLANDKREQKILNEEAGFLLPANDPDPPGCEMKAPFNFGENSLKVYLGSIMVSYSIFPHNIFTVNGKNPLILNRDESGRIALTMDILDKDGKVVVQFDNGHFTVNQNARLDMKRPDRSTLIVHDNYGNEVLNIRYLNKHSVAISALLQYSQARPVRIEKTTVAGLCEADVGATGINFNSPM